MVQVQQGGVEADSGLRIGGEQLAPSDGAVLILHLGANQRSRLPEAHCATGRVGNHCDAAGATHVYGLLEHGASQAGHTRHCSVNVLHGQYNVPVRRRAVHPHSLVVRIDRPSVQVTLGRH